MTSELHMYVMKKQAWVSGRKSTNRKPSFQSGYSCLRYLEESSETNTTEARLADVHIQIWDVQICNKNMILLWIYGEGTSCLLSSQLFPLLSPVWVIDRFLWYDVKTIYSNLVT